MDQLVRIKDTVFSLFSPRRSTAKPDLKRRRTIGHTTPSKDISHEELYEAVSEPRGEKAQAALYRRITGKYLPPQSTNPRKRGWADEDITEDIDMVQDEQSVVTEEVTGEDSDDHETLSPHNSVSQVTPNEDEEVDGDEEGDEEDAESEEYEEEEEGPAEDPEAIAHAKVEAYLATQHELTLQKEALQKVKAQGNWHPAEVYLFERLSLRSYEVLIPQEWQIDFPTLPGDIFARDKNSVLINYNCLPSSHGLRALQSLVNLGSRIKGAEQHGTKYIAKALKDYVKWTERDGGYFRKRHIPILTVCAAKPKQSSDVVTKNLFDQMKFLAQRHREHLAISQTFKGANERGELELYRRQPPLLYGIVVIQNLAFFSTLDSSKSEAQPRHIAHFDFTDAKVHVWSGFALAIICVIARNNLMAVKHEFEDDTDPESDPDL